MGFLSILNPLGRVTEKLADAYLASRNAQTDAERIKADVQARTLEAQREVLIAEQASAWTRWVRPALAFPSVVFVWKVVLWDSVLGWGVTPDPGELVRWIVVTTIGAFLIARPFEKWVARR